MEPVGNGARPWFIPTRATLSNRFVFGGVAAWMAAVPWVGPISVWVAKTVSPLPLPPAVRLPLGVVPAVVSLGYCLLNAGGPTDSAPSFASRMVPHEGRPSQELLTSALWLAFLYRLLEPLAGWASHSLFYAARLGLMESGSGYMCLLPLSLYSDRLSPRGVLTATGVGLGAGFILGRLSNERLCQSWGSSLVVAGMYCLMEELPWFLRPTLPRIP